MLAPAPLIGLKGRLLAQPIRRALPQVLQHGYLRAQFSGGRRALDELHRRAQGAPCRGMIAAIQVTDAFLAGSGRHQKGRGTLDPLVSSSWPELVPPS